MLPEVGRAPFAGGHSRLSADDAYKSTPRRGNRTVNASQSTCRVRDCPQPILRLGRIFGNRGPSVGKSPRLLAVGEDVYVRGQRSGLLEGTDTDNRLAQNTAPAYFAPSAIRQWAPEDTFVPLPLLDGVVQRAHAQPLWSTTRSSSIIALCATPEPVSR